MAIFISPLTDDIESMLALKEESHKLKDEIRTLKKELDASSKEVESVSIMSKYSMSYQIGKE